jgi:hypothetical protein
LALDGDDACDDADLRIFAADALGADTLGGRSGRASSRRRPSSRTRPRRREKSEARGTMSESVLADEMTAPSVFPLEALDANRRGELTDQQRRGLGALSRYRRRNGITVAAFLLAGAALIGLFASPSFPMVWRTVIVLGCCALALFRIVLSVTGTDSLTRDLRDVHVQSVEGAIGKRRASSAGGRNVALHFLDVGDAHFKVGLTGYREAPDAGYVKLYFLPRSRKVVNLERLSDDRAGRDVTRQDVIQSVSAVAHAHGRRASNEARADLAAVGDAMRAVVGPAAAEPHGVRDPRPLAEAILGRWTNGFMTVTFSADGAVTATVLGRAQRGRWSVDAAGRLHADVTGQTQAADAWVADDTLSIAADGNGLTFTRAADQ